MNLLIYFVIPLATILLAIVLQKILRSPILVAITFFAIYLVIAFVAFADTLAEAIIAVIIYTIIAFVTALIVRTICELRRKLRICCRNNDDNIQDNNCRRCNCNDGENDLLTISCNCNNGESSDLLTVSSNCLAGNSLSRGITNDENIYENIASCQPRNNRVSNVRRYRRF